MNYVEMIDDLRTAVYKNIREISGTSPTTTTTTMTTASNEYLQPPSTSKIVRSHPYQLTQDDSSHFQPQQMSSGEEEDGN